MRILFLNHNLIGRGTYWRCFHLARELVKLGEEVTLVSASAEVCRTVRRETREGVSILITPRFAPPGTHDGGWAPVDILYRLGWIAAKRFDVIHAFAHRPSVVAGVDYLMVMSDGKVEMFGPRAEVLPKVTRAAVAPVARVARTADAT